jgi:CubicO group peptidase (beta-lactamase class C family)
MKVYGAICSLAMSLATFAQSAPDELVKAYPKSTAELEQEIRKVLDEHHTKAVAIALANREGVFWTTTLGATPATRFRIGSITKSLVALAVLQLVEQGKLSLDARYRDLAPEIPFENPWEATDPVRLVHVLEHTAGFDDFHLTEYAHSDPRPVSLKEGLLFDPRSRTSRWRPGTRFSYCNSGPPMAAYVVEKITGQTIEDYVQQHLFDPIGMPGATFFEPKSDFAGTYIKGKPQPYWHVIERPAGSVNATARDMGNYVLFFLNRGSVEGGKALVSAASIDRMETPTTVLSAREAGLKTGYGLHNYTTIQEGFLFHGHNGGVNGGLAELAYSPENGIGYSFMINSDATAALKKISILTVRFLTRNLKKPPMPDVASGSQPLADGTYFLRPASPRMQLLYPIERILGLVEAEVHGPELRLEGFFSDGEPSKFLAAGPKQYRREKSPFAEVAVVRDDGDTPALQIGFQGTFHLIPGWLAWLEALATLGFLGSVALVLVAGPFWIYRWTKGSIRTQVMPGRLFALASVLVLVIASFVVQGPGNDFEMLGVMGKPSAWSVSFLLLTVIFAGLAILAFVTRHAGGLLSRWASRFLLVGMLYFGWWGWVGIRTWHH